MTLLNRRIISLSQFFLVGRVKSESRVSQLWFVYKSHCDMSGMNFKQVGGQIRWLAMLVQFDWTGSFLCSMT